MHFLSPQHSTVLILFCLSVFTPVLASVQQNVMMSKIAKVSHFHHGNVHKIQSSLNIGNPKLESRGIVSAKLNTRKAVAQQKSLVHNHGIEISKASNSKIHDQPQVLSKAAPSTFPLHKDGIAIQPPGKWAGFNPRHASEVLEVITSDATSNL